MTGEDPVSMETVMKQLSGIGATIETTLGEVNAGLLTDANKDSLTQILANIASVTKKIDQGEGTVGKFLTDPSFYKNLEEFSADVKSHPWKLFYRPKK